MSDTTGFPAGFLFQCNSPITTGCQIRVTGHLEKSGLTGLWERYFVCLHPTASHVKAAGSLSCVWTEHQRTLCISSQAEGASFKEQN